MSIWKYKIVRTKVRYDKMWGLILAVTPCIQFSLTVVKNLCGRQEPIPPYITS